MKSSTKEIKKLADLVERIMVSNGVVVQRYDAYTTNSVYLKFDGGLANSLRIGDHKGKKHLNYMFMIDVRQTVSIKIVQGKFRQYIYSKKSVNDLAEHILRHRIKRIESHGSIANYRLAVQKQFASKSDQRGFWSQSRLVKSKQTEWLHEDIRKTTPKIRQSNYA